MIKSILILVLLLVTSCTAINTNPAMAEPRIPEGYWIKEGGNIKFCFKVDSDLSVCSPMPTKFIGLSV